MAGLSFLVTPSLLELPRITGLKRATGVAGVPVGAVVSTVTLSVELALLVLPAASVALTVMLCAHFAQRYIGHLRVAGTAIRRTGTQHGAAVGVKYGNGRALFCRQIQADGGFVGDVVVVEKTTVEGGWQVQ